MGDAGMIADEQERWEIRSTAAAPRRAVVNTKWDTSYAPYPASVLYRSRLGEIHHGAVLHGHAWHRRPGDLDGFARQLDGGGHAIHPGLRELDHCRPEENHQIRAFQPDFARMRFQRDRALRPLAGAAGEVVGPISTSVPRESPAAARQGSMFTSLESGCADLAKQRQVPLLLQADDGQFRNQGPGFVCILIRPTTERPA